MIIDAHAHAAGKYASAGSILETAKKYQIERVLLVTSPKNNQDLKAPPNVPFMKSPDSIFLLNRMLRLAYRAFKDGGDGNRYVFSLRDQLPGLLLPFLWVNPLDSQHMGNLENNIQEYRPAGIKLHQAWDAFQIDGPQFGQLGGASNGWACTLGFWSALITTLVGVIYFLVILAAVLTNQFTFPPSNALQLFGGISSLVLCPLLVILMASIHGITPAEKKVFSQISLAFSLLFAMAVSINRFTQLGVVRQSIASGRVQGVDWFLPYGDHSIMLGLEMMGWGWFLGMAMLFAAPIFTETKLERWLSGLLILYGGLGLVSSIAFLLSSPLSVIGFVAWGLILFIITALLAIHFMRFRPAATETQKPELRH